MFFEYLDSYSKFYFIIASISTILFVVIMIMTFMGHDYSGQSSTEGFSTEAFELMSLQSILAFFMGFGWVGLAAKTEWDMSNGVSVIIAGLFGIAMMLFTSFLMKRVKNLNKQVQFDIKECIGIIGQAYTVLEPNKIGQVQIKVSGKLMTYDAINDTEETISSFSPIIVKEIDKNVLIIEPYVREKGE